MPSAETAGPVKLEGRGVSSPQAVFEDLGDVGLQRPAATVQHCPTQHQLRGGRMGHQVEVLAIP